MCHTPTPPPPLAPRDCGVSGEGRGPREETLAGGESLALRLFVAGAAEGCSACLVGKGVWKVAGET